MNKRKIQITILIVLIIAVIVGILIGFRNTTYKISFYSDNVEIIEGIEVKKNSKIYKPADPSKDGYTFDGWYYNNEKFDFNTLVSEDIKLEARWISQKEQSVEVGTNPKDEEKDEKEKDSNKTQTTTKKPTTTKPNTSKPSTTKPNTNKPSTTTPTTKPDNPSKPEPEKPAITYSVKNIENSTVKQVAIYVLKDGKPVNGQITINSKSGKSATVSVPSTGLIKNADAIASVSNPKAN